MPFKPRKGQDKVTVRFGGRERTYSRREHGEDWADKVRQAEKTHDDFAVVEASAEFSAEELSTDEGEEESTEEEETSEEAEESAESGDEEEIDATDAAVALAEEEGIDLSEVEGTGEDGRILKSDVE